MQRAVLRWSWEAHDMGRCAIDTRNMDLSYRESPMTCAIQSRSCPSEYTYIMTVHFHFLRMKVTRRKHVVAFRERAWRAGIKNKETGDLGCQQIFFLLINCLDPSESHPEIILQLGFS